jgi:hypothetical protein
MGNTIRISVDESLAQTLERIRKEVAIDLKKRYNLQELTVHGTLASQIAAAKMSGKSFLNFQIDKTGLNKGILRLLI